MHSEVRNEQLAASRARLMKFTRICLNHEVCKSHHGPQGIACCANQDLGRFCQRVEVYTSNPVAPQLECLPELSLPSLIGAVL
jgi:hypothetical protein